MGESRAVRPIAVRRVICLALVAVVAMAGCGSDDAGKQSTTSLGATPTTAAPVPDTCNASRVGGTATMGIFSETSGLDPAVSSGGGQTGGTELAAIYDTLMQWNPQTGDYEPRLAQKVESDATFTQWTITLRAGVKFGNGDPFTAAAIAANFDRHKDPATKSPHRVLASLIKSTTVVDDLHLVVNLVDPWAEFPYLLSAQNLGLIPNPKVIAQLGAAAFNLAPVGAGAGPYEFVQFVPNEKITLRAKTDYWNGPVCIQQLNFVRLADAGATYDAVKVGTLNVGIFDDAGVLERVRTDKANYSSQLLNGQGLLFNNGLGGVKTTLSNVVIRKAILAALDPKALDLRINQGFGDASSSLFSKKSVYSSDVAGPVFDAKLAASLVTQAKADGTWNGKIRLTCTTAQASQALAVKTALDAVGFNVEMQTAPATSDLIRIVVTEKNFDMACWSLQVFDAGAWVKLERFLGSTSTSNRSGYANPAMDAALADLRKAKTPDDRKRIIGQMQTIWNETAPSAIIRAGEPTVVWGNSLHGLTFNGEIIVHFDKAYIAR
ncbi:MAG: ABC transporter substrate-binding protein [Acidimicrobiales bacterium]